MMWWYGVHGLELVSYGWWAWHMAGFVFVWIVLNVLVVIALQRLARPAARENENVSARRDAAPVIILQERYVRGEIGRDEFIQKKQDLGATGS
jgi:uncharacterized membrane protein